MTSDPASYLPGELYLASPRKIFLSFFSFHHLRYFQHTIVPLLILSFSFLKIPSWFPGEQS